MPRISLATNCFWRTRAPPPVMRRASAIGVRELLGQAEAVDEFGRRVDQPVGQVLDGLCLSLQFTFGRRRDAAGQLTAAHSKILP